MKNHFIFSYFGNKRDEVEVIYNNIVKNNNLDNLEAIIEPYCGSSAMSYYISTLHPKKFRYVLNDNDKLLIELYKIFKDKDKIKVFVEKINKLCFDNDKFIDKETYKQIIKQDNIYSHYISHKFYNIRIGNYPYLKEVKPLILDNVLKTPIIHFLQNEDILFRSDDAIDIIKEYNHQENLILCDPPYLATCNDFYANMNANIYEWLTLYSKSLSNTAFILENNWIIKLLFNDVAIKEEYAKSYNGIKKKKVKHVIAFYKN